MPPSTDPDITDDVLVARSLTNPDAFASLIERYEGMLFRYIRRLTNEDDAHVEDVLDDTFVRIYRHLSEFDARFPFRSWIYRIAHNTVIDHYRANRCHTENTTSIDDETVRDAALLVESTYDTERDFRRRDVAETVQKIIALLSPKYRDVLILSYFEHRSYDEMSDILKVPPGTVATLIHRAKTQFRNLAARHFLS